MDATLTFGHYRHLQDSSRTALLEFGQVVIGAHDLRARSDTCVQTVRVEETHVHRNYKRVEEFDDLSLVKLASAVVGYPPVDHIASLESDLEVVSQVVLGHAYISES